MAASDDPEKVLRRRALSSILTNDDFRPLSSTVRVEFGARSVGLPSNEDHYLVTRLGRSQETFLSSLSEAEAPRRFCEYAYAMLIASGLGGAGAGGLASRIAISTLVHLAIHYGRWNVRVDARTAFEIIERLDWCYSETDRVIKQRSRSSPHLTGMATRLTAAYSAGDELFVVYTGESRAYILRGGRLLNLSLDATTQAEPSTPARPTLVASDEPNLSEVLHDALGGPGTPRVHIARYQLQDADVLLLANDGLLSALSEDQIADMLGERRRPSDACDSLVVTAIEQNRSEDVTVIVGQYRIPAPVAAPRY